MMLRQAFHLRFARSTPARRCTLAVMQLEDRTLLAGNLLLTAEVPGQSNYDLMQYTQQGTLVSSQSIPKPPASTDVEDARGLSVDPSGNINIYNGTFNPYLATLAASTGTWSYQTYTGWSTVNNVSYGTVAAYKGLVFASDMYTAQDPQQNDNGIVEFGGSSGSPTRLGQGTDFIQVALGLDGLVYGLETYGFSGSPVEVFNPDTGVLVRTFNLKNSPDTDIRSIAIDGSGYVLAATWAGYVAKFDPTGSYVSSVKLKTPSGGTDNLDDIALDTDGQIAVGGWSGNLWLTNESLATPTDIQTNMWSVFPTFNHYIGTTTATPTFSSLAGPTIVYGTASTTLGGTISGSGNTYPTGNVNITLNGVTKAAPISSTNGTFSASFSTGTLSPSGSPYTITYAYPGDSSFGSVTDTSKTLTVTPIASLVGSQLQIQNASGSASVVVELASGDPTTLQVLDNGNVVGTFATSAVTSIAVNLTGGNNSLTIDQSNGDPVPMGGLSYEGSTGGNTLTVNGASTTAAQTINIDTTTPTNDTTFDTITGMAAGVIIYEDADTSSVLVDTGSGADTIHVHATGTALTINTGSGTDTLNVGSTGNALDSMQGPLTVTGQAGHDTLNLLDQGQATGQAYTLTPTTVSRPGVATVTYGALKKLSLAAGSGNDTVQLSGTLTVPTALTGGGGSDTLIGPNLNSTWTVSKANAGTVGKVSWSGFQSLVGGSGNDTFKFTGSGSLAGTVSGGGGTVNKLDYSALAVAITINLQTQAAPLINNGAAGGFSSIQSFAGNKTVSNTLIGPDATTTWTISTANGGKAGTKAFSAFANLVGGSGVDVFKFTGSGNLSGTIDGGAAPLHQGNWLDYSSLTGAVNVNLQMGSATGVAGGVSNIQNVHGSNGGSTLTGNSQGNILIGGTGSDVITGGSGLSLLIGDQGADQVNGGSGADILIGNSTTYDSMNTTHEDALMAILAEWQSADSYATRFHDINTGTGGGLNGAVKLYFGKTVNDDSAADTLTAAASGQALDWFFQGAGDTLFNQEVGEHINNS